MWASSIVDLLFALASTSTHLNRTSRPSLRKLSGPRELSASDEESTRTSFAIHNT